MATMFRAHPEHVAHARALLARGFRPEPYIEAEAIIGTVTTVNDRQHVDRTTWAVMHLMALPVRGEAG